MGIRPASDAPCTLFWPRNGCKPAPSWPTLPVNNASEIRQRALSVPWMFRGKIGSSSTVDYFFRKILKQNAENVVIEMIDENRSWKSESKLHLTKTLYRKVYILNNEVTEVSKPLTVNLNKTHQNITFCKLSASYVAALLSICFFLNWLGGNIYYIFVIK